MKKIRQLLFFVLLPLILTSCASNRNGIYSPTVAGGTIDDVNDKILEKYIGTGRKMKIGIFLPLTSNNKNLNKYGASMLNAAQMTLFNSRMDDVILMTYDTKGNTFGASAAITQAVKDGVNVIIGPLFPAEVKAIASVAKQNDIVVLTPANDQTLMNLDNVFVTGYMPEQEIQLLLTYAINNGFRNVSAFLPMSNRGSSLNAILRRTLKDKDSNLIKTEYYLQDDKAFSKKLLSVLNSYKVPDRVYEEYNKTKLESELKGEKADTVQLVVKEEDKIYPEILFIADAGEVASRTAQLLFQLKSQNRDVLLMGTSRLDGDQETLLNPYLDGAIFVGSDVEKFNDFLLQYSSLYGETPVKMSTIVYDLMFVAREVFRKSGDGYEINKEKLLNPNGFEGIDGRFRFLPNGLVERRLSILQIRNKEKVILDSNQEFLNY